MHSWNNVAECDKGYKFTLIKHNSAKVWLIKNINIDQFATIKNI